MITLAVASFAQLLATQLRGVTGGEDGLTFSLPRALSPAFRLLHDPVLGVRIDGRVLTYYLIFAAAAVLFLAMLRIANSPFGRVLQAIRENAFRAEALGYRVVVYRTVAGAVSAAIATLAGGLLALSLRYTGPDTTSVVLDHGRRGADGGDRRHGHAVRPGAGRGGDRAGAALSAAGNADAVRRR